MRGLPNEATEDRVGEVGGVEGGVVGGVGEGGGAKKRSEMREMQPPLSLGVTLVRAVRLARKKRRLE